MQLLQNNKGLNISFWVLSATPTHKNDNKTEIIAFWLTNLVKLNIQKLDFQTMKQHIKVAFYSQVLM